MTTRKKDVKPAIWTHCVLLDRYLTNQADWFDRPKWVEDLVRSVLSKVSKALERSIKGAAQYFLKSNACKKLYPLS